MKSVEGYLKNTLYITFIVLFSVLYFNVVFNNMHFDYKRYFVIPSAIIWFATMFWVFKLVRKNKKFVAENEKKLLCIFFFLLAFTQILFFTQLASYPTRDLENVFRSAYYYAIQGQIDPLNIDYLYKHPNNLTWVIRFQFVFRIARKFGADSYLTYIIIASVINGIAIAVSYFFTYLCCKKLMGVYQAFYAIILLYTCLPLQFNISFFYTDTLTMMFIPMALYMYLICSERSGTKAILPMLISAAAISFGIHLKYSVVIVVIAIVIDTVLKKDIKTFAVLFVVFALTFSGWKLVLDNFTYSNILDKSVAKDAATPFSSYIMMGLKGDGSFDVEDRYFAWSFETKEEKEQNIKEQIKLRLQRHTPITFIKHLNQKGVRSFGSGNMEYNYTISNSPVKQTYLVQCVSPGTKQFTVMGYIVQGWHIMLFALVISGRGVSLKKKDYRIFVPVLSILGLYLFLLIWESSQRYLINYMCMYIICAVYAVHNIALKE